jgi:acyl dehydratase
MPIDPEALGATSGPFSWSWDSTSCILYALGVGAGPDEAAFTTDNTEGVPQEVLPTFATLGAPRRPDPSVVGHYDPAMLVHGEHRLELAGALRVSATVSTTSEIVGIWDKGSGAVVVTESRSVDAVSGEWLFTNRASAFIRGEGGWGGARGPSERAGEPSRPPDEVWSCPTREDQALLYRLCGDRNPLHSDPRYAARAGFERPILHGLCTWGFTGRALLSRVCGSDPGRMRAMQGRFAAPVYPGDTLTVSIWVEGGEAVFRTATQRGDVVIQRGRCALA